MALWQGVEIEYAVAENVACDRPVRLLLDAICGRVSPDSASDAVFSSHSYAFLRNGGKAYIDTVASSELLELCTPECPDGWAASAYERSMDQYVKQAYRTLEASVDAPPHAYRATSAYNEWGRRTTRGLHESYAVSQARLETTVQGLLPFLAIRPLFTGSGGYLGPQFVVSPRQAFVQRGTSAHVSRDHPIIALGKEPLAENGTARLHICSGEATRAQVPGLLRQLTTSWVIAALDVGWITAPPIRDVVSVAQRMGGSPWASWDLQLENGRRMDAIAYLRAFYVPAMREVVATSCQDRNEAAMDRFLRLLEALEARDFASLRRTLEWCVKLDIIHANADVYFAVDSEHATRTDVREALDFQYRAVTDDTYEHLEEDLGIETMLSDAELAHVDDPPPGSRAGIRVAVAQVFGNALTRMDWDGFTVGTHEIALPTPVGPASLAEARRWAIDLAEDLDHTVPS